MIKKFWKKIRPVKKRIYRYGKVGLNVCDDRSKLERICDWLDGRIELLDAILSNPKKTTKHVWNSYFDAGLGRVVSSYEEIRQQEKKGWIYWTPREMQEHCKKVKAYRQQEDRRRIKLEIGEVVRKIKQGYSYSKDLKHKVEETKKERRQSIPIFDNLD